MFGEKTATSKVADESPSNNILTKAFAFKDNSLRGNPAGWIAIDSAQLHTEREAWHHPRCFGTESCCVVFRMLLRANVSLLNYARSGLVSKLPLQMRSIKRG